MRLHRINLAHSQDITARLLEAMVDSVPSLELVEIEGDAVFLYAPDEEIADRRASASLDLALTMHRAFHARQQWMVARNMCSCEACKKVGMLRVKFVAHLGEVATQNDQGADEAPRHRRDRGPPHAEERRARRGIPLAVGLGLRAMRTRVAREADRIDQRIEGVGMMTSYCVHLDAIAREPATLQDPGSLARLRETNGVIGRCFPRVIGILKLRAPDRGDTAVRRVDEQAFDLAAQPLESASVAHDRVRESEPSTIRPPQGFNPA